MSKNRCQADNKSTKNKFAFYESLGHETKYHVPYRCAYGMVISGCLQVLFADSGAEMKDVDEQNQNVCRGAKIDQH